jgi:outer membrane protein OmpA-like peptidoglycan-associated protein
MPPHPLSRGGAFFILFSISLWAMAQKGVVLNAEGAKDPITVVGRPGGSTDGPVVLRAVWSGMDGPAATCSFQFQAEAGQGEELGLEDLIVAGVEQYLDQRIHFNKVGVTIDLPVDRMVDGIDRMVAASAQHFGVAPIALSPATRQQLQRVSRIDWSKATFGVDGGEDQEKYLAIYYYVRSQRQELERQLRNDLVPLDGVDVLGPALAENADPGRTDSVPTVCNTVFDDQNFLCPLDLKPDSGGVVHDVQLTDDLLANIAASAQATKAVDEPKLRKRDRWLKAELDAINGRIDKMDQRKELWALRDRMDAMEGRVDKLDSEVEEIKSEHAGADASENPMANLSALTGKNLTVYFAVGSATVEGTGRALLKEVAREMGRSPKDRVLITGYTDATGSPPANLELSERRAKAVRSILLELGIAPDRLLLNYYGSGRSSAANAAQRRVEIEWLP